MSLVTQALVITLPELPSLNDVYKKMWGNKYGAGRDTQNLVWVGKIAALQAMPSDWQPFEQTKLTFIVYRENLAKYDIHNLSIKAVIDGFVKAGLIVDDSFKYVPEVAIKFGGVDKDNPRVMCLVEGASL
jgi:hypothetical protein